MEKSFSLLILLNNYFVNINFILETLQPSNVIFILLITLSHLDHALRTINNLNNINTFYITLSDVLLNLDKIIFLFFCSTYVL